MVQYILIAVMFVLFFVGIVQMIKSKQGKPIRQYCQHCHKITPCYYRGTTLLSKDGVEYAPRNVFDWYFRKYSKWECTECGKISYFHHQH